MSPTAHRHHTPSSGEDDVLSVLLEAVVLCVVGLTRLVWWLVVQLVRMPLFALCLIAAVGIGVRFHGAGLVVASTALVTALIGWRFSSPATFQRFAWPQLVGIIRTLERRSRWPRIARRSGLVVHDWTSDHVARSYPVRLTRVHVSSSGLERLYLRLPAGMAPSEIADKADALAHALRCRDARVVPDRPGRIVLELWRTDTLQTVVAPLSTPPVLDLASVPIGRCEDGRPWTLRLTGTHLLIAGATGSGKSSVLWSMLRALTPGMHDRTVQVWAVDPKGGMELGPGRRLFTRFEDRSPEQMCAMLEELVELKDARARTLASSGTRLHQPRAGSPHVVVILDELATLTAFAERSITRRIDQALGLLLTQGRACGITVVAAVQDPGKDIVGWRDLFPTRIAMRLDNPIQVAMVLGEGAKDLGAKADEISELTPGVAYVRVEGTRQIRRVRASYLTDDDIARLTNAALVRIPDELDPEEGAALHVIQESDIA